MDGSRFDVIVAGAGPGGSSCANLLAQSGKKVLILDKSAFPRDKICGECIHPRCWSLFRLLDVAEVLEASPHMTIDRVFITNSLGSRISTTFAELSSQPIVAMRRSLLDMILVDRARSRGVHFLGETPVLSVEWSGEWKVEVRSNQKRTAFYSDVLIAADGRNSSIARKFSTNRNGIKGPKRVAFQWHTSSQPIAESSLEMFLFDSGYAGIVNVDSSTANVAMVTTSEVAGLASKDFSSFLDATLFANRNAAFRFRGSVTGPSYVVTYPINPTIRQCIHQALHLVGDAHQTVEPFTGEGIFFALQDGISTARRILTEQDTRAESPFWSNRIFSPILRRPALAESLISVASGVRPLVPFGFKTIFGS